MEDTKVEKRFYSRWWFWVGLVILFFFLIGLSGSNSNNSTSVTAGENQPSVQTGPLSRFSDGNYIVGTDIEPGTYKNSGGSNCYWERLSGFGGSNNDIIANDNTAYPTVVTIASTDKGFDSQGCGTWTKISTPSTTSSIKTTTKTSITQPTTAAPAPTPTPTPPSTPVPASASWHTVTTFSGSGGTNTNAFQIQGTKWRIDWSFNFPSATTEYCQQYGCNMAVQIFKDDNTYVDQFLESGQQPSSGTVYEYGNDGTLYLHVVPGNVSWTLTVEDYY